VSGTGTGDGLDDDGGLPPPSEAFQKQHGWQNGQPPRRILTGAAFVARHVPPVWLIDGIVQRSRLYACTSITGHGKTAVWLFNACMIHNGRMIGLLETFQSNVLYLAGENPADLEARMIGMARAFNIPLDKLPYVLPGSFPLTEEEADALKQDIVGLGVPLGLIVGDTASSFFPGLVAEPMSEEAVADHTKQAMANEDVVLKALRDHPEWSYAKIASEAGWIDKEDRPERWLVQRAITSLAEDKMIEQARKRARWTLTTKGEKALDKGNL
jgi:hypothetical protein